MDEKVRKWQKLIPWAILFFFTITYGPLLFYFGDKPVFVSAQMVPVIRNPSFERPYYEQGAGEVKVADKWTAWWWLGPPPQEESQGPCARPEYKPVDRDLYPYRVIDGDTAQCWFAFSRVMDAGLKQKVENVQGQSLVTFSLYGQTWCSNSDDPHTDDGECYLSLGVDPTGHDDPRSVSVRWIQWVRLTRNYQQVSVTVYKESPGSVTLFVRGWNKWRHRHSDYYIDSAKLSVVPIGSGPTPTPYPTYTSYPTSTPHPTYTPYPTYTPGPGPTPGTCPSLLEMEEMFRGVLNDTRLTSP